jgi:hypothetical protein
MGSTLAIAATTAAASRGALPLVRLPLAAPATMLCVLAMFPAPIQIAPEAT